MRTLSTKIIDKRLSMMHGMEAWCPMYCTVLAAGLDNVPGIDGLGGIIPACGPEKLANTRLTYKTVKILHCFVYDTCFLLLGISDFIRDW